MEDTTSAALDRYYELLEGQPPHRRLAQAMALSKMTRELAMAGLRERHPTAAEEELRVRLAALLYGRAVAARLFANVPDDLD